MTFFHSFPNKLPKRSKNCKQINNILKLYSKTPMFAPRGRKLYLKISNIFLSQETFFLGQF